MTENCWSRIGVWGNLSCPQLEAEIHCHNCAVYSQAGRALLERLEPDGYAAQWAARLALPETQSQPWTAQPLHPDQPLPQAQARVSLTLFRLGQEWLALPADLLDQVASPSPVHSLPHCHNSLMRGIVNVRGQLLPCVSLHALLEIEGAALASPATLVGSLSAAASVSPMGGTLSASQVSLDIGEAGGYPRLVVIKNGRDRWAFEVSELYGLYLCQPQDLRRAPSLSTQALASFTQSILAWQDQNVSYLDAEQLFAALRQQAL